MRSEMRQFMRAGSVDTYPDLISDDAVRDNIETILEASDIDWLVREFDREDAHRVRVVGSEYSVQDPRRRLYLFLERRGYLDAVRQGLYRLRRLRAAIR